MIRTLRRRRMWEGMGKKTVAGLFYNPTPFIPKAQWYRLSVLHQCTTYSIFGNDYNGSKTQSVIALGSLLLITLYLVPYNHLVKGTFKQ